MSDWPPGIEQARCANCRHRRIYHFVGTGRSPRGPTYEHRRPCSLDSCGCLHYTPSNVRVISG